MRIRRKSLGRQFLLPSLLLMVVLTACGSGNANATPTLGVDAIFTAAYQTIQAQEATQLALTPPTNTPSPSPFPTLPPPSPIATISFASSTPLTGGSSACDNSAYMSDITIPDGTTIKAGEKFTKTWRLFNSGTCNWSTSYKLAFDSGDLMSGGATSLPAAVPSGSQVDISVVLTAPTSNGTFKGNWRMQNASGVGFGNVVYVEIKVGSGSGVTVTPGPSPTGGPTATSSGTSYTISGNAGVGSGVTVTCVGDGPKPIVNATVNNNGDYSCTVPIHWRGYVEPLKPGWNFTPPQSELFDDVLQNQVYNFIASQ